MKFDGLSIGEEDSLFRCVVFPSAFDEPDEHDVGAIRIFDTSKALDLRFDRGLNQFETSVAWQKFAPMIGHVHSFGCRLASKANAKRKRDALPVVYCGAYEVTLDRLFNQCRHIPGLSDMSAMHVIEEDEIAHANLQFRFSDVPKTKDDIAFRKTDIMNEVSIVIRGPLKHVCAENVHLADHPSDKLVVLPAGAYCDTRSNACRVLTLLGYILWLTSYRVSKFLKLSRQ
jgi:hypothetical protein